MLINVPVLSLLCRQKKRSGKNKLWQSNGAAKSPSLNNMLYFIFGPDTYRSHEKLKELVKNYQQKSFEAQKIGGESVKLDEFKNKINSASLLSVKRLLVIENLLQNSGQREITQFLSKVNLSKDDILIFYENPTKLAESRYKPIKNISLYKFLQKNAECFEFELLPKNALKSWIQNYVKKKAGKIEPIALEKLLMAGNDLWFLTHELDKLLAYNKQITLKNVQLLSPTSFDDNIFNLADAIGQGNKALALELINGQLDSGAAPIYLLSMIIRQFRILIQVKEATEKQKFLNYSFIAKELNLHPFVVQKSISQARKYSFRELEKIYQSLQELDLKLKTTKLSAKSLFMAVILKISQ